MKRLNRETMKPIVDEVAKEHRCNCDLDNWQPEEQTGHSWVCRIHKIAMNRFNALDET